MGSQKSKFARFLSFHFPLSTFRFPPFTFYFLLSTFHFPLRSLCLSIVLLALFPFPATAQFSTSPGLVIQLIGIVQVEPGPNVITLDVQDTEIRFQARDLSSTLRDFTVQRFLSDIRYRSPSLYIKGPEHLLDLLLKEKPSKRVLKLSGVYYPDARRFLLNKISSMQDLQQPQF